MTNLTSTLLPCHVLRARRASGFRRVLNDALRRLMTIAAALLAAAGELDRVETP
jgi:hypothetical protein